MLKRHPYLITILITTIVSLVAWSLVPKKYGAQTKLVDEYKETGLSIGMNAMTSAVREALMKNNEGINDIEVYCKMLATEDFARELSHKEVPGKGITYGEYLADEDTIETILGLINYNLNTKQQSVIVELQDHDPLVAAQMLDSITHMLQDAVTTRRHDAALAALGNAQRDLEQSKAAYNKAQAACASFQDSHMDGALKQETTEETKLQHDSELAFKRVQEATEQYARQKALSVRSVYSFAVSKVNTVPLEEVHHPYGYTLFAVILALLLVKGVKLYVANRKKRLHLSFGDISSPWSITLIVWIAILVGLCFRDPQFLNAPKEQFYVSVSIWLLLFCPISFLTYNLLSANSGLDYRQPGDRSIELTTLNRVVFYGLLGASILITPLYLKKIMDVAMMFGTEDLAKNLRLLATSGSDHSWLNYSIVINETLMIVSVCAYPKVKLWVLLAACTACLLNAVAIMEKGGILLVVFCVIFILFQRKLIKIRTIVVIGLFVILLSWGFNLLRTQREEGDSDTSLLGFISMYLLSPPVAYCTLPLEIVQQFGVHTFPMAYLFLNRLTGTSYMIYERTQDFVFVPISTNVYTIFQPFYMDFGQLGVAIFAIFYGVMTGWAYHCMRSGSAFGRCIYTYFAYVLALQFFQEYIFTGNMHVIQLIAFLFLCTQKNVTFLPAKSK